MSPFKACLAMLCLLALCCSFSKPSLAATNGTTSVQLFPPANAEECTGGGILTWDGVHAVSCVHIPTCSAGSVPVFVNGAIECQAVYSGPCQPGTFVRGMSADGVYVCCPQGVGIGSPSCTQQTLPAGSCLPSGYPDGQSNDIQYPNQQVTIQSCGQANGHAATCCSHVASWENYNPGYDPWGTLTRHGHPLDGTWYECLCR